MKIKEIQNQLIEWYWNYGSKREGVYRLSRANWLDRVVLSSTKLVNIEYSEKNFSKPAVALWGPSQAGKSTLLGKFIDWDFEKTRGALSWGKDAVRFLGTNSDSCISVNPYNHRSDASGCVTRFVMCDSVANPEVPVEVEFAGEREILMSLAFGYLTEVDKTNNSKIEVFWDERKIDLLIDEIKNNNRRNEGLVFEKSLYFRLLNLLDVIECLILSGDSRYKNLGGGQWAQIREKILLSDILIASENNFKTFVSKFLWDDVSALTKAYQRLLEQSEELKEIFPEKANCSLEVASLLLDISAATSDAVRSKISKIVLTKTGDVRAMEMDNKAVPIKKMFNTDFEFAYSQALVQSLVVPLRKEVIQQSNIDVYNLLEQADIVDFPGVANEEKDIKLLKNEDLEGAEGEMKVLSKVLKRGKTASIVVGYARNLNIDIFSIFSRTNEYIRKPTQLYSGINAWCLSMLGKEFKEDCHKELPLNIVQTFAVELIKECQIKYNSDGLKDIFEKLKSSEPISDPNADFFAINYHSFGKLPLEGEALKNVVSQIKQDRFYRKYYNTTLESMEQMCLEDGGRGYFFRHLLDQVKHSKRNEYLKKKKEASMKELLSKLQEALPPEGDDSSRREQFIANLANRLEGLIENDEWAKKIGFVINRQLLSFSPENFERAPSRQDALFHYANKVYDLVRSQLLRYLPNDFIAPEREKNLFIEYWTQRITPEKISDWLKEHWEPSLTWTSQVRLPLLNWIERQLESGSKLDPSIRTNRDAQRFLAMLLKLKGEATTSRGVQKGDTELQIIKNNFNQ